jgi:putative glycosyltransferase
VKLSIVTTLYRSAQFIGEFHRRASAAAANLTDDFEIVFVDDGSPDDSRAIAVELHKVDPRVVVVDLSRNFGHHRAMMTGLMHARGERVFLIDVDLDADPEDILQFWRRMDSEPDCDVVYGVQEKRSGSVFERASGELFYWLVAWLGGIEAPRNLTTTRLMTRRYVRDLVRHRERELVISGLWAATGYRQVAQNVLRHPRKQKTNYHLLNKLRLAIDYITSFSANILYNVLYAGMLISVASFVILAFYITRYLVVGSGTEGWTSLIVSIWLFGGLNLMLIGLIGLYIARIFQETKRRPYAIVRQVYRHG